MSDWDTHMKNAWNTGAQWHCVYRFDLFLYNSHHLCRKDKTHGWEQSGLTLQIPVLNVKLSYANLLTPDFPEVLTSVWREISFLPGCEVTALVRKTFPPHPVWSPFSSLGFTAVITVLTAEYSLVYFYPLNLCAVYFAEVDLLRSRTDTYISLFLVF